MFRTHLIFAFLMGLVFIELNRGNKYLFLFLVLVSGIIPDIDYPRSKVGRRFWLISKPLYFLFGHRRLFHSLFFLIIVNFFVFLFFSEYYRGVFIGYGSHIFLDMMTKQGVMLFYPFKFKISGIVKTGGLFERVLFFVFVFLVIMKVIF